MDAVIAPFLYLIVSWSVVVFSASDCVIDLFGRAFSFFTQAGPTDPRRQIDR